MPALNQLILRVSDYDLAGTLTSGQAFRWRLQGECWEGVIFNQWVRLRAVPEGIEAETTDDPGDWRWLTHYLQTDIDLPRILATFPPDEPLLAAVAAWRGLRLLRQDPWECLASFICSSTKQIVQIQQIIEQLCARFGEPITTPAGDERAHAFPTAERIATCTEAELRACKMGFRAPYVLAAARAVAEGRLNLEEIGRGTVHEARARLEELPGVGRKIADCVLLFAYGFQEAFPMDVWVMRALRELYFPRRRPSPRKIREFSETHFGPHAGYAQQYLFHYMRMRGVRGRTKKASK